MKYVTFISGLKIEKVPHFGRDELAYQLLPNFLDDGSFMGMSSTGAVHTRTVPIFEMFGLGRDDGYIAYSEEVEKLLGIPIRTLVADLVTRKRLVSEAQRELDSAQKYYRQLYSRLTALRNANLWQRIKFVFTRELLA